MASGDDPPTLCGCGPESMLGSSAAVRRGILRYRLRWNAVTEDELLLNEERLLMSQAHPALAGYRAVRSAALAIEITYETAVLPLSGRRSRTTPPPGIYILRGTQMGRGYPPCRCLS